MNPALIRSLKRLRRSQPFNAIATTMARGILQAGGWQSELVLKHLHRVGSVEQRLPNGRKLRLWSQADDLVSNLIYWRGWQAYEPGTSNLFYRIAAGSRVTVDVGAYVGFFTLLAGHANAAGRILAIEPFAPNFERLSANVFRNGLTNVECIPVAVGAGAGEADFYYAGEGGLPCSSGLSSSFLASASHSVRVPVRELDAVLEERHVERVDLVKLDTETTEPDVLRGMKRSLARDRPQIFCEVLAGQGTGPELERLLGQLGYSYFHLTPDGPVRCDRITGHPAWLNYLFTTLSSSEVESLWADTRSY